MKYYYDWNNDEIMNVIYKNVLENSFPVEKLLLIISLNFYFEHGRNTLILLS
jgi:hypothetical protein